MRRWEDLEIEPKGSGISSPLSGMINLVGALLGHAIREQAGEEHFEKVEKLRQLSKKATNLNDTTFLKEVAEDIRELTLEQIHFLIRAFTTYFHLVNKMEQLEISRINQEREKQATPENPRAESIEEAIFKLKTNGYSLEQVLSIIGRLDIQPTLTAHPTEARRRSILQKQQQIARLLAKFSEKPLTSRNREEIITEIYQYIALILATDEVRAERLKVLDEVRHGLYFFTNSIWETIPKMHMDLQNALNLYYGKTSELPNFLNFRSWIGGDRDGNPHVTPTVTRQTLRLHRETVIGLYLEKLTELRRDLSVSARLVKIPRDLMDSLKNDEKQLSLNESLKKTYRNEPFRLKIDYIIRKLQRELDNETLPDNRIKSASESRKQEYKASDFIADLQLIRDALLRSGLKELANNGKLQQLLIQAKTFGLHLMALDFRQHSGVHTSAVSELLKVAGVNDQYMTLSHSEREKILSTELQNPRPLLPKNVELSDSTRSTLETFETFRLAKTRDPQSVGIYIISMTHHVSHLLEVLLLAKETGLWRISGNEVKTELDVVPLVETIDDLLNADKLIEHFFSHNVYRRHLEARENFQEIMLGYSDSDKDGGYWTANWALHQAQQKIAAACNKHQIDFRLFHGRGGTVGRGGGRANQAILAMPQNTQNGRIRFTEQGEVISFRYALTSIAHRHLEQIVNAMLLATKDFAADEPESEHQQFYEVMENLSKKTMKNYRDLIFADGFWEWYTQSTPIEHISKLPIASRPVSRSSGKSVDFESLRAIPWVFAWTQTRMIVPGWFGIGKALEKLLVKDHQNLEILRRMYREWTFFRTILDNARQEMGRARLQISQFYEHLSEKQYLPHIKQDYDKAESAILKITEQNRLLDNRPVIQKSIHLRNPYTDVLNLLQVELMQRWRTAPASQQEELRYNLFLSINGIAAAMQSTG